MRSIIGSFIGGLCWSCLVGSFLVARFGLLMSLVLAPFGVVVANVETRCSCPAMVVPNGQPFAPWSPTSRLNDLLPTQCLVWEVPEIAAVLSNTWAHKHCSATMMNVHEPLLFKQKLYLQQKLDHTNVADSWHHEYMCIHTFVIKWRKFVWFLISD